MNYGFFPDPYSCENSKWLKGKKGFSGNFGFVRCVFKNILRQLKKTKEKKKNQNMMFLMVLFILYREYKIVKNSLRKYLNK